MKIIWAVVFLFFIPCPFRANPVDATPIAEFSELVFDDEDRWALELFLPFRDMGEIPDSIVIRAGGRQSRLKTVGRVDSRILVITADSLNEPTFSVRRDGDTLEITTYSTIHNPPLPDILQIRMDGLIFGDMPGAGVGSPEGGFSILRSRFEDHRNTTTVDCLTRHPSLGEVNVLNGLEATLSGTLFDSGNEPVTGLKREPWISVSPYYLELETPIRLSADGSYETSIYRRFDREVFSFLTVKMDDFEGYSDTTRVEPFELEDIRPGTEVVQDIRLKTGRFLDRVEDRRRIPESGEITLINYPNPFNGETHFFIGIPQAARMRDGCILILDTRGRRIRELPVRGGLRLSWDGRDKKGSESPSGCYFYRLVAAGQTIKSGSMLLLR